MDKSPRKQSVLVKVCSIFVFLVIASLGLLVLYFGYAPERYTRFGYTQPLYGRDAYLFGVILITLSLTPLLRSEEHTSELQSPMRIAAARSSRFIRARGTRGMISRSG